MPMPKVIVATITMPFLAEARLMMLAHLGVHAGVVPQRLDTVAGQPGGSVFDLLARQAIHDAAVMPAIGVHVLGLDEGEQLVARVVLLDDAVADVRPVEAGDEHARIVQRQPLDDLLAGERVGRGRECNTRHLREALVQHRQLDVLGPEVVAPLRHAVRLVDREQPHAGTFEQVEEARRHQPLGRHIEDFQPPGEQVALHGGGFAAGQCGIEHRSAHAGFGAAPPPDPASGRSAARRRYRHPALPAAAAAPESGSRATSRRRWA